MTSLSSQGLTEVIQAALRAGDKQRVSVLRMLSSSLRNAEVSKPGDLTDEEAIAVVAKEVRRREEAAQEFEKVGRRDRADAERDEAQILREWLPEPIDQSELARLVEESIAEVGATGASQIGSVMKVLMPKIRGRADGKTVSAKVKEKLG